MSLPSLPKELRLQIYTLSYLASPPRPVALATLPHPNPTHSSTIFCPRYSPSPAPALVNICREARAEVAFQARRREHVLRLPSGVLLPGGGPGGGTIQEEGEQGREFYFRVGVDVLYVPLEEEEEEGEGQGHVDDSPENGLLAHFLHAVSCPFPSASSQIPSPVPALPLKKFNPTLLRSIAVSKIITHGFRDGALSNVLRLFPHISHLIMMVPDAVYTDKTGKEKEVFVRAGARIVTLYKWDLMKRAREDGTGYRMRAFDVDFGRERRRVAGKGEWGLDFVERDVWREWSDGGDEWATLDGRVDPFW